MREATTAHSRRGYVLQEIIVGLVIFAIAMIPIVRGLALLPQLGATIGEQSRREAWRTAADQAVLEGLDPGQTALLRSVTPHEAPPQLWGTLTRKNLPTRVGAANVSMLSSVYEATPEDRAVAAGFEIGASSMPAPPRVDPLPPLLPIKLSVPSLTPSNGSPVPVLSLARGLSAADPFVLSIEAVGGGGDLIHLRQSGPQLRDVAALGSVALLADAVELAESVRGRTWSEYSGNSVSDIPIDLGDGRTRWLVRAGPRMQVYEPSDPVDFIYGLDLGRPAYSFSGVEYPSGGTVSVDYAAALLVESGTAHALVTYPEDVTSRFGTQWERIAPGFTWSIGNFPGDSSAGNTVSFYRAAARGAWSASQRLTAKPVSGLAGLRLLSGSWTIERQATELQAPERIPSFYDEGTDAPGQVEFSAPVLGKVGQRVGRPEVNSVQSVNASLAVPLVP